MAWWLALAFAGGIPVQGMMTDAQGAPLDGSSVVVFRLHDGDVVAHLYESTQTVHFAGGGFAAALDGVASSLFRDHADVRLSVEVGGVRSPTVALSLAPYAAYASYAGTAANANSATLATTATTATTASNALSLGGELASAYTLDSESVAWSRVTGAPAYTAGAGLTLSGTEFAASEAWTLARARDAAYDTVAELQTALGVTVSGGDLKSNGTISLGNTGTAATCGAGNLGTIRWTGAQFQGCTGAGWVTLGATLNGSTAALAGRSCQSIRQDFPLAASGVYWLDPELDGANQFQTRCEMTLGGGGWTLAMNINTSDGHISGWGNNYWYADAQYNTAANALTQDFRSQLAFKMAAGEIMVTNHTNGTVKAWKRWQFTTQGTPLQTRFNTAYRTLVTGDVLESSGTSDASVTNCPIMRYGGGLYFNFYYGNNGVRLMSAGQTLESENQNNDTNYGLGMEYCHQGGNRYDALSDTTGTCNYSADAAVYNAVTSCQGTDHGVQCSVGNAVSYHYGIWIR